MSNKIEELLIQHEWEIKWAENFEEILPYSKANDYNSIFREDMFLAEKQIGENHYIIDIGAYGRKKVLKMYLIKNQNWENPLIVFRFSNFIDLYNKIKSLLQENDKIWR